MKKILGLDLGTNSIGWALVKMEEEECKEISGAGARIIPAGNDEIIEFQKGQTKSKAAERRQYRMSRRINHRYIQRRDNLVKVLLAIGIMPEDLFYKLHPRKCSQILERLAKEDINGSTLETNVPETDIEHYSLRLKALNQPVSSGAFGRILYHFNQRRGYQSTRKERKQSSDGVPSNYKKQVETIVIVAAEPTGETKAKKNEYLLHLNDGRTATTLNEYYAQKLKEPIQVETRWRKNKNGEETLEVAYFDPTDWQKRLDALDREFEQSGMFPGAYFHSQLKLMPSNQAGKDYRIRQQFILRKRYIEEFNAIWDKQEEYHSFLKDESAKEKAVKVILPENSPERKYWLKRPLKELVRDYIIYYQRPLKTKRSTIGHCTFEPLKKVTPKSHPDYQEFRVWQAVHNLRYLNEEESLTELSKNQKVNLFEVLSQKEYLEPVKLPTILQLPENTQFRITDKLPGNETLSEFLKAARKAEIEIESIITNPAQKIDLWHIIYSVDSEDARIKTLRKRFGWTPAVAQVFADLYFERDFGSLSARAVTQILPLMRVGQYFNQEDISTKAQENIKSLMEGVIPVDIPEDIAKKLAEKINTTPVDNGFSYSEAAALVYGQHANLHSSGKILAPENLKPLPAHSLRNPLVEKVINETLQLVAEIWRTYGKPDEIRVELARELKQNNEERKKSWQRNLQREKKRKEVAVEIKNQKNFGISQPSKKDIDRYLLWEEAGFRCIYSGKNIPVSALFNGETDVDHILPKERFFDDSFANKVLVFRSENERKTNKTAYEYMQGKGPAEWDRFENEVKNQFRGAKKRNLLAKEIPQDFVKRQLNETRYISRKVKEELQKVCPGKIFSTSGTITDYLKSIWDLHETFKKIQLPRFERMEKITGDAWIKEEINRENKRVLHLREWDKRIDHRHHALDAIVVAVTRQGYITQLNTLSQQFSFSTMKDKSVRRFKLPNPAFRSMVMEAIDRIIVSHRSRKRLTNATVNHYLLRDPDGKLIQKKQDAGHLTGVRGELHEQQPFGPVQLYERIKVEKAFENLGKLAVDWQKALVKQRLTDHNGDKIQAKKSLKKSPLVDMKGEPLSEVIIFETRFAKRRDLNPNISEKQLKEIADRKLQRELLDFVDQFPSGIKEAFTEENLEKFNQDRHKPVFKVRTHTNGNPEELNRKFSTNDKLFVEKGNNYCFVIYEHEQTKERSYEVVSFYDAVMRRLNGEPLAPAKDGCRQFTLSHNEIVYVPESDEVLEEIDWTDTKRIAGRLYKVEKFTSKGYEIHFSPIHFSLSLSGEFIHPNPSDKSTFTLDTPRISIKTKCIKVFIDRLGRIKPG